MSISDTTIYLNLLSFFFKYAFPPGFSMTLNSIQFSSLKPVFHFHSLSFHITRRDIRSSHPFHMYPFCFGFHVLIIFLLDYYNNFFYLNVLSLMYHPPCVHRNLSMQMLPFTFAIQNFALVPNFQRGNISLSPAGTWLLSKFICDTYHSSYVASVLLD